MDLGDDHALRPVDDEGSPIRHQGDVAEVDFLLAYLPRLLEDEVDAGLQGNGVGEALLLAFQLGVLHGALVQGVALILQEHVAVGAFNGEGSLEDFLKPRRQRVFPAANAVFLQEPLVAGKLYVYKIRKFYRFFVVLADVLSLYLLLRIGHPLPPLRAAVRARILFNRAYHSRIAQKRLRFEQSLSLQDSEKPAGAFKNPARP